MALLCSQFRSLNTNLVGRYWLLRGFWKISVFGYAFGKCVFLSQILLTLSSVLLLFYVFIFIQISLPTSGEFSFLLSIQVVLEKSVMIDLWEIPSQGLDWGSDPPGDLDTHSLLHLFPTPLDFNSLALLQTLWVPSWLIYSCLIPFKSPHTNKASYFVWVIYWPRCYRLQIFLQVNPRSGIFFFSTLCINSSTENMGSSHDGGTVDRFFCQPFPFYWRIFLSSH